MKITAAQKEQLIGEMAREFLPEVVRAVGLATAPVDAFDLAERFYLHGIARWSRVVEKVEE